MDCGSVHRMFGNEQIPKDIAMILMTHNNDTQATLDTILLILTSSYGMDPFEISRYDIAHFVEDTEMNFAINNLTERNITDSLRRIFLNP